jgi:hypothetical protein
VSLLSQVVERLESERVSCALIGAAAMAVHGVSRATADVDLLTIDARVLRDEFWAPLAAPRRSCRVLKGDADDPLAGSVRVSAPDERTVDIVVGRYAWQGEIVTAAKATSIGELTLPVVEPADLILLKLHAGGPKDAWDVRSLLESHEQSTAIRAAVDRAVARLPAECRRLWERVR